MLVGEECVEEVEYAEQEWGCLYEGLKGGSSLEVGWGWCHLAGEVGQVE